jgi:hypothetical protein
MTSNIKKIIVTILAAFVFGLIVMPALAQDAEPEPTAEPAAPVVVVPVEIQETAQDNALAAFALFAGITLIVIGVVFGVVIRYVAGLVPAEYAAPVYTTGNTFYTKRQTFIQQKRAEALKNNIWWDDLFWDAAEKASTEDWQRFVDEAKAKGVTLQITK